MGTYDDRTMEELKDMKKQLDAESGKVRGELKLVNDAMDKKLVAAAAKAKVDAMSDPERAALAQALSAVSIPSGEKVGTPGAK